MSFSYLPPCLSVLFLALASGLDRRLAFRLPQLLVGLLFARGRRTVTSWFRAAGVTQEFRQNYRVVAAVGRQVDLLAAHMLRTVLDLEPSPHLTVGIDDTPSSRWGPCIEGAGIHHNPNPGPAGERFVYGHVFVTMAVLVHHPVEGVRALPLRSDLYVRQRDLLPALKAQGVTFRTKLEMACGQLQWLRTWTGSRIASIDAVMDGAYAKRPVLREAKRLDVTVFSRLPKNAALRSMPATRRPKGRRGPMPTYGKHAIVLAERAEARQNWKPLRCLQYGKSKVKRVKTFLATWHPAGGAIRVAMVQEEDGWRAYFCTDVKRTAQEILEKAADRGALEETFKDVKEVWGAEQQQLRNVYANIGAFNLNSWMYTAVHAWGWNLHEEDMVDRRACPWDSEPRRASAADKRKALQREMVGAEIQAKLAQRPTARGFRRLMKRLVDFFA